MKKIGFLMIFVFSLLSAGDTADITAHHRKTFGAESYNKRGVAHILTPEGWVAINRRKQVLYTPFIYDNGPDYVHEGLLRFVENGKMGFVNEAGKKVIKAQFDFVFPFEDGWARFCNDCKMVKDGEHSTIDEKTGAWGKVNKKGKIRKL